MKNTKLKNTKCMCGVPGRRVRMAANASPGLEALDDFERDYFLLQVGKIERSMHWHQFGCGQSVC